MHTGQIYSEVARSGYGALPPCPSAWLDEDTVQELAGETVVNALNHFKFNVLMKNKWDATKREPACRRSS
jgi:3-polyprenyl-4-hydroxybenzoate decarboxylase